MVIVDKQKGAFSRKGSFLFVLEAVNRFAINCLKDNIKKHISVLFYRVIFGIR